MNTRLEVTGKRLPSAAVCERYDINRRTLGRWMIDPDLGFPPPITINGRHYFEEDGLIRWERANAAARAA